MSSGFNELLSTFSTFKSFRYIFTNLAAFHSLLAKFLADSTFSGIYLISLPADIPCINENLKASVPYSFITSIGSIPLPKDLDIFLPCSSLTIP
ncbi:hypothetical protein D3C71_1617030 [compost metagenome]